MGNNSKDPKELKIHITERIAPRTEKFLKTIQAELKRAKGKHNRATAIERCVDYCQWAHDEHRVDILNFK